MNRFQLRRKHYAMLGFMLGIVVGTGLTVGMIVTQLAKGEQEGSPLTREQAITEGGGFGTLFLTLPLAIIMSLIFGAIASKRGK
jgi:hypothetical protein